MFASATRQNAHKTARAAGRGSAHPQPACTVGITGRLPAPPRATLVQLIPRLYDATEGTRPGRRHRCTGLRSWRSLRGISVAMVLQKNTLFSGSIKENLRWGNADASGRGAGSRLQAGAARMNSSPRFPDGYDTPIEQGGSERFRRSEAAAVHRPGALLKKPKILILDDSTSAVDTHDGRA